MKRPRDFQRSRLYAWERQVSKRLAIDMFAEQLTLDEARSFVERVWREERTRYGHANREAPPVKDGRGRRKAGGSLRAITLPRWSRNPWVVLHEMAHAVTQSETLGEHPPGGWHGEHFLGCLIGLACRHMGLPREILLGSALEAGLRVDQNSIGEFPVASLSYAIERVLRAARGPMLPMEVALELRLGYRAVLAAARELAREGTVLWRGKRLVPGPEVPDGCQP